MDTQKVDMFITANQKFFPAEKITLVREKLLAMPDEKYVMVSSVDYKDPTTLLIVSLFLGTLGVDRFMIGDVGLGVLKLLTGGCCGILTIIDWFTIMNKTKEVNFTKLMALV